MGPEARDAALAADVSDVLAGHRVLADRSLTIEARGGVLHVQGEVATSEERRLLREVLGRVRGVLAVWDRVGTPGRPRDRVLDVGCGPTKQWPGTVGADRQRYPGVDVLADLEAGLPFAGDSFDQVFAVHVLEHVHGLIPLMNELHRVLRPSGVLHAMVPRSGAAAAVGDPTHVRFFEALTFRYFCGPRPGLLPFRPVLVTQTDDTVFADLEPVKAGQPLPSALELTRAFA